MLRRSLYALALLAFTVPVHAAPTDPIVLEVPDDSLGPAFPTGFRTLAALAQPYVEDELLASGAATLFTYNDPPVPTEIVPLQTGVPYKTRLMVRRPADPAAFNGTVVIEWWNSTAGFDAAPSWDVSAEYFGRKGIAYVGVTNSDVSIGFLRGGCSLFGVLPPACGTRYATLSLPENGLAYEMMGQIAHAIRSGSNSPLPPEYAVKRVFHVGQSQQGGSVITYATAFHLPDNDGYFVQAAFTARAINAGPACGSAGAPAYPGCTPQLAGADRLVRTDLRVPVIRAQTETDLELGVITLGARQTDADFFRYYELAGTAHNTIHKNVTVPVIGLALEDFCQHPMNSFADGPVLGSYLYNAMWESMEEQLEHGRPMPRAEKIAVTNGAIVRDAHGNAVGGLRLPELDVPIASYAPQNVAEPSLPPFLLQIGGLVCRLSGAVTRFDDDTLRQLYPSRGRYTRPYVRRVDKLVKRRFLLEPEAEALREAAGATVNWLR